MGNTVKFHYVRHDGFQLSLKNILLHPSITDTPLLVNTIILFIETSISQKYSTTDLKIESALHSFKANNFNFLNCSLYLKTNNKA